MADKTIYRASTTAPVNIAVIKYIPLITQRSTIANKISTTDTGESETQNSTSQLTPLSPSLSPNLISARVPQLLVPLLIHQTILSY
jgi:hypothetical protein